MATTPKTYISVGGQTYDASLFAKPTNRNFRDAWMFDGTVIAVDMAKAKPIAHARRRAKREEVFTPHRVVTAKAAQGIPLAASENAADALAAMSAYKANVDDVCQIAIEAATTPEGLDAALAALDT